MSSCLQCGSEMPLRAGPGRPRKFCTTCKPASSAHPKAPTNDIAKACVQCGNGFHTRTPSRRYCSEQCRWLARKERDGIPCADCGKPTGWTRSSGITHDVVHKECGRLPCGTVASYRRGCRCSDCRKAIATAVHEYAARRKAEGRPLTKARSRNRGNRYGISPTERVAIYERDNWTCLICSEPVDRSAHWNDLRAPTLDHIEPQSVALVPDHSPSNLRTTHRICNAIRGNRLEVAAC